MKAMLEYDVERFGNLFHTFMSTIFTSESDPPFSCYGTVVYRESLYVGRV